ncbi:TIR-like protein FxsC [Dactylosporangium salmoneum]|uniref:TIR domain-containing protein n=1 Tax=Dactylosporangium salmoneum TaxID=53361 RepID=A0ABP5TVU7_9ACTN
MPQPEPKPDEDPESGSAEDPSAPLFFLSYARMRPLNRPVESLPDPNRTVRMLFGRLSMHLNNLVYRETGTDPGFMDVTMAGGERWSPVLMEAVGTCQVFVALLSPTYLQRPWCAREWNAFAARTVRPRPGNAHTTSIVPVLWTSTRSYRVPESIQAIQLFVPERLHRPRLTQRYLEDGLYGLLLGANQDEIELVIFRLAQRIAELHFANHVEPGIVTDPETLPNTIK